MSDRKFTFSIKALFDKTGITKTTKSLGDLSKKVKDVASSFGTALNAAKNFSKNAALAVSGVVATMGGLAIQSAKFNIEVARAQTMTDKLGFRELRKGALDLSQEIGVAKDQIANGLYQALSAGVPADNVFSFVSTAAKVAVTDGSDVATAVDGISTILNAFKLDSADTDKVVDAMFKTVATGKTTFAELASSMSTAAPAAAALGVGYDQILAATATLTKQGEPTASAMNKIRNIMLSLNTELGEGWSKTRTLQDALVEVAEKGGNSALALEKAFGKENVSGVLGLVGENARAAKTDLDNMANSVGALNDAHAKVDAFSQWNKALASAKAFITNIGDKINETIKGDVTSITEKIKEWNNNTAFWDGLETKMKSIRTDVVALVSAISAGEGGEIWTGAKNVIVGAFAEGGKLVGSAILSQAAATLKDAIFDIDWSGSKEREKRSYTETLTKDFGYSEPEAESLYYKSKGDELSSSFTEINSTLDTGIAQLKAVIDRNKEAVSTSAQQLQESGTQAAASVTTVTAAGQEITEEITASGEAFTDAASKYSAAITDENGNIIQAYDAAGNAITEEAAEQTTKIETAATTAQTALTDAATTLTTAATTSTGQIATAIQQIGTGVTSMSASIQTAIAAQQRQIDTLTRSLEQIAASNAASLSYLESSIASVAASTSLTSSRQSNMRT